MGIKFLRTQPMTNKSPLEQIEVEAEIALNTIDGQDFLKKLFINYHQIKSQVDVDALKEALKQADALHIGDGNPLTDLLWLDTLRNAAQTFLTLMEETEK